MRFALILLLFISSFAQAAAIDRFKAFLSGTKSARGEFEQKVHDRSGKVTQESKGSFVFQRPGLFRWVYAKPDRPGDRRRRRARVDPRPRPEPGSRCAS
jgi:outer membrane lipoprotein carrier protein